ncbi:hypothetical protein [Massilia orientalis]|uniref:Uncharacterized protein n=1 Tax=Massilia orientalis TaxID=3050128 RepID=A0ACC7MR49_9BURK|nr:hypothetical protein [Massilia sp. YIM B02787]
MAEVPLTKISEGLTISFSKQKFKDFAIGNALGNSLVSPALQSGQDFDNATMSPRQAERAQFGGLILNDVLGGEKNYLGMLGAYASPTASSQSSSAWDSYVAAWRADNPTYQVIPKVYVYGRRETAEPQLNAAFGLNKKVTFANANSSRIEAQ